MNPVLIKEAHDAGKALGRAAAKKSGRIVWTPDLQAPAEIATVLGRVLSDAERASALEGWCEEAVRFGYGAGSISEIEPGHFRVSLPAGNGKQAKLPVVYSWNEANKRRLAALNEKIRGPLGDGNTLRGVMGRLLDRQRIEIPKTEPSNRTRWEIYFAPPPDLVSEERPGAPYVDWPVDTVGFEDVAKDLLRLRQTVVVSDGVKKTMEPSYVRAVFSVLRMAFNESIRLHLRTDNPCRGQRLPKIRKKTRSEENMEWLDLSEQESFLYCKAIPEIDRFMTAFAIGSGLRVQEQIWLLRRELVAAVKTGVLRVWRQGPNDEDPKNGARDVVLVAWVLDYAERCLDLLPEQGSDNPLGLAFPYHNGEPRQRNRFLGTIGDEVRWPYYRRLAGITKNVTWHGLRKTCGSSLISGLWGKVWTPQEGADYVGDTLEVFLRHYARMSEEALHQAARETRGGPRLDSNRTRVLQIASARGVRETSPHSIRKSGDLGKSRGSVDLSCSVSCLSAIQQLRRQYGRKNVPSGQELRKFHRLADSALAELIPVLASRATALEGGAHHGRRLLVYLRELETLLSEGIASAARESEGSR